MKNYSFSLEKRCLRTRFQVAAGFTLVEMLVVITIITVMLTVGALGLKNLSKASGVSAGLPVAEAVFAEARAVAIGKGGSTRILINADVNDHERYLRYMLVVYYYDDGSGRGKWIANSRGSFLPEGVYFSQEFSRENHEVSGAGIDKIPAADEDIYGGVDQTSANTNLSGPYFYYEFNGEGNVSTPGASFVIGVGSKPKGADNPKVSGGNVKNFGGLIIWRKGTTSVFRHPDQMDIPSGIKAGDKF